MYTYIYIYIYTHKTYEMYVVEMTVRPPYEVRPELFESPKGGLHEDVGGSGADTLPGWAWAFVDNGFICYCMLVALHLQACCKPIKYCKCVRINVNATVLATHINDFHEIMHVT